MSSASFDEYLQNFIDTAPVEELLLYAAHRDAIIAKRDTDSTDNDSND